MAETTDPEHSHDSRQRAADVQRGTARAAVLGVSDGLVTNVSLILGVSAAETPRISETFVTSPSLTPNTAARAVPR